MSLLQKFKFNSHCVEGRHYSGTNDIRGFFTSKGTKMLKGNCVKCRRNKSMTVSDATTEAEGWKDFFKSVDKATVNFGKKVANNPVRALEIAIKIGSAAASRNPRAALSATTDLIKFANIGEGIKVMQKGRGLYLGTKKRLVIILEYKYNYDYIYYLIVNINTNIIITKYVIINKH